MTRSEIVDTISVCRCCMLVQANGECGDDCHDAEPLALIGYGYSVTAGLTADEHLEGCTPRFRETDGCECDQLGFSWRACDGCGSNLGGDRFALTLWRERAGLAGVRPGTSRCRDGEAFDDGDTQEGCPCPGYAVCPTCDRRCQVTLPEIAVFEETSR